MLKYIVWGFFAAIIAGIVFVQAGRLGGESGGSQTARIIGASGESLSKLTSALETGNYTA